MHASVEVVTPKFDLHGHYEHHVKRALDDVRMDRKTRTTKLKLLIQRAYEQGVEDGARDETYFDR